MADHNHCIHLVNSTDYPDEPGQEVWTERQLLNSFEAKLLVLEHWVTHGIPYRITRDGRLLFDAQGEPQHTYYPRTLPEFCKWSLAQNGPELLDTLGLLSEQYTSPDGSDWEILFQPSNGFLPFALADVRPLCAANPACERCSEFWFRLEDALNALPRLDRHQRERESKSIQLEAERQKIHRLDASARTAQQLGRDERRALRVLEARRRQYAQRCNVPSREQQERIAALETRIAKLRTKHNGHGKDE